MSTEVELKAWVDEPEAVRKRVAARFEKEAGYIKEDVYYRLDARSRNDAPVEFRLRREEGRAIVTGKRKKVVEGVEINDEIEYTVSSDVVFERFAEYLGAKVFARKRKVGERYRAGAATIELSEVDRLGHFIEIEWLVEGGDEGEILRAKEGVRRLLRELDIPEEKIEPRYYVDLLSSL